MYINNKLKSFVQKALFEANQLGSSSSPLSHKTGVGATPAKEGREGNEGGMGVLSRVIHSGKTNAIGLHSHISSSLSCDDAMRATNESTGKVSL